MCLTQMYRNSFPFSVLPDFLFEIFSTMASAESVLASDSLTTTRRTTLPPAVSMTSTSDILLPAIVNPPHLNVFDDFGLSHLHHYVRSDNVELKAVHQEAYPTAIFYVTTILAIYVCGLLVILIHYMNSSYGRWAWTLNDVWDELRYWYNDLNVIVLF